MENVLILNNTVMLLYNRDIMNNATCFFIANDLT